MSEKPDSELIRSVWAEARDLVKRLEGSTVQRFAVKAGEYEIEIERGAPAPIAMPAGDSQPVVAPPITSGAGLHPGVSPGGRGASAAFSAVGAEIDLRMPVLAPLVGTFYRSAQPGSKPFVEAGDVVEAGQTVCIVEAMKLMNEVAAPEKGKVAEVACENGDPVEFEQVLMYLEPVD